MEEFFLCVSLVEEFHSEAPAIWLQLSLKRTCVLSSSYLEGKVDGSAELTEREIITEMFKAGLSALEEATEVRYENFKRIRTNPDLENIRGF
ncbi:hypothetical protein DY000_02059681 [Brassica cretica]|uniref:Uncharacterized protein n=1 Tax=Brassica cretica TaxID=69181 RepID=A0ABQ7AQX2_BRACR|nr:hypothetical protein DY000_02059681 [Brassica cretica]